MSEDLRACPAWKWRNLNQTEMDKQVRLLGFLAIEQVMRVSEGPHQLQKKPVNRSTRHHLSSTQLRVQEPFVTRWLRHGAPRNWSKVAPANPNLMPGWRLSKCIARSYPNLHDQVAFHSHWALPLVDPGSLRASQLTSMPLVVPTAEAPAPLKRGSLRLHRVLY